MDENERRSLGKMVEKTRLRRGLGKEKAAREVGVSSITLKRIEDGRTVRDDNLARVLTYFGLPHPDEERMDLAPAAIEKVREIIENAEGIGDLKGELLALIEKEAPTPPPADRRKTLGA